MSTAGERLRRRDPCPVCGADQVLGRHIAHRTVHIDHTGRAHLSESVLLEADPDPEFPFPNEVI